MSLFNVFKERLAAVREMKTAPEPKFVSVNEKNFRRLIHDAVDGLPEPLLIHYYDGVMVQMDDSIDPNLFVFKDKDGNLVKRLRIERTEPEKAPVEKTPEPQEVPSAPEPVKAKKSKFLGKRK